MTISDRVLMWVRTNPYKTGLMVLATTHAFMSLSAHEFNEIRFTEERMLEVGRLAAHAVFFGDVKKYNDLTEQGFKLGPDKVKQVQACEIQPGSTLALEGNQRRLINDLYGREDVDPLKRFGLLKADIVSGHFATLTFSVSDQESSLALWHKSLPMVVTISMKYTLDPATARFTGFAAQLLNTSYLPNAIRKYVSGDWGVLGEIHSMCASGYSKAILAGEYDNKNSDFSKMTGGQTNHFFEDAFAKAKDNNHFVVDNFAKRPFEQFIAVINDLRYLKHLPPVPEDEDKPTNSVSSK